MEDSLNWHLLKNEDGAIFGPIKFGQLKQWATEAQVSPLDKVSNDGLTWIKAPMVPELEMDYLIEVSPDQFYGPTTIGAVREFIHAGEITGQSRITNCRDGSESLLEDVPELMPQEEEEAPVRTSIRVNLQRRIRDLEEALEDERRALEIAQHQIKKLEAKLETISG